MQESMKAAFNLLMNDSPLGIILKPILNFIKKTNMGSSKVLEVKYDEVLLNEHKSKPKESIEHSVQIPKDTIPDRLGVPGRIGVPGNNGTNGTAGKVSSNSTSSLNASQLQPKRIIHKGQGIGNYMINNTDRNVYYSGTFEDWFNQHNKADIKIKKRL